MNYLVRTPETLRNQGGGNCGILLEKWKSFGVAQDVSSGVKTLTSESMVDCG